MGNPQDQNEDRGTQEQQASEQVDGGRSGEGAASAMEQMISQGKQHRHLTGEADDAAGGRRQ